MYKNEDIEYALDILRSHSHADSERIERWLAANPHHLDLLRDLAALREIADTTDYRSQLATELRRIKRSIRPRGGRKALWWSIAASVAVAAGFFLFMNVTRHDGPASGLATERTIPPGELRAVLILTEGDMVALDGTSSQVLQPRIQGVTNDSVVGLTYKNVEMDESGGEIRNTLRVPPGSFYTLELSDGTKVWMNADSELNFPVKFLSGTREVTLGGEAYFEVARDRNKPFIVHMDGAEINVLGTSFNVSTYGDDGNLYATLESGSISFRGGNAASGIVMQPGRQVVMNMKSGRVDVRDVDVSQYTSWRNGKFVFESMTLETIMKQLHRWYDVQIEYRDPAIKNYEFKGVVNRNMNMEDILGIIAETTNIKFEIEDDKVIMMKR